MSERKTPRDDGRSLRRYAWTVAILGLVPISLSIAEVARGEIPQQWLILAGLALLSGFSVIRVPSLNARVTVSETFVFASALLFGPAPATLSVVADGFVVSIRSQTRKPYQIAFNFAEPAISVWLAAQLFYLVSGMPPLFTRAVSLWSVAVPLVLMAIAYFVLNAFMTAKAIELDTNVDAREFLRTHSSHLFLNFGVSVFLLFLIVSNADNLTFATLGIIAPMMALSYYSSKSTMAVVEKSNQHLAELNELYLSTVETLAMAINAKDHVTHGHIRRVQDAVVALAERVGVADERELKAIRAAALLHDLGKIAIPEHILNKPGDLTESELEQMKTHAEIGANIVSRINFPYPVEPIVRHHHENWDGSGYPAGLHGTDIPVGCRVLSIVDCFDALRSHRPYRRQLTEEEAMEIVQSRRGTMYDPEIVDAFVEIRTSLELGEADADNPSADTFGQAGDDDPRRLQDSMAAASARVLPAWLLAIAPDAVAILYRHDPKHSTLRPAAISHGDVGLLDRFEIPVGKRPSGWVAANQQTIINSDAQIDFENQVADVPEP